MWRGYLVSQWWNGWRRKKGYDPEEKYHSIVRNWRSACDERGLSSDLHNQINKIYWATY